MRFKFNNFARICLNYKLAFEKHLRQKTANGFNYEHLRAVDERQVPHASRDGKGNRALPPDVRGHAFPTLGEAFALELAWSQPIGEPPRRGGGHHSHQKARYAPRARGGYPH